MREWFVKVHVALMQPTYAPFTAMSPTRWPIWLQGKTVGVVKQVKSGMIDNVSGLGTVLQILNGIDAVMLTKKLK